MASRLSGWIAVLVFAGFAVASPVVIANRHSADASYNAKAAVPAAGDTVKMAGLKFAPKTLIVARGTNVLFDNNDVAPHTVTATDGSGVDSGIISPGRSFRLVIDKNLTYFCAVHPFMKAKVVLSG